MNLCKDVISMTITITHLYYDLLNLYGESGNVKALKNYLESIGIKVKIQFITISDEINLSNTDFVYIGSGTEQNQFIVLKHMIKYKDEIKNYIDQNGYFLATGNSIELFGNFIEDDKKIKCLELFSFATYNEGFRIVDEALFKTNLISDYILGFRNSTRVMKNIEETPLFEVIKGTGSYPKSTTEGIVFKNFYGTYLIGPLLARNPSLLVFMANHLIKSKNPNLKIKKGNLKLEIKAYKTFLDNYYNEYVKKA